MQIRNKYNFRWFDGEKSKNKISIDIRQGDCLELMKTIPNKSIDMILCDLPFGTTRNSWDKIIPFEPLWEQYKRIIKDNGAIVLFSQQPFTADLINSNRKMFRYEWIWNKVHALGFLNANKMPLRVHENICVFYKSLPIYNAQKTYGHKNYKRNKNARSNSYGKFIERETNCLDGSRFPLDIIQFSNSNNANKIHPTQKPTDLLEYLIKTYTNKNEIVLDNCMGSGSTGVACINTNRNFIGYELNEEYFYIAKNRIWKARLNNEQGRKSYN